jgi:secreted trypsin-like serine protease
MLNSKVLSILGVSSALLFANVATAATLPVVGGDLVSTTDVIAKRTVGLFFIDTDGSDGLCSGSILDSSHILTAAHCVQNFKQGVVVFSTTNMINLVIAASQQGVSAVPELRLMTGVKAEPGYSGQQGGGDEFNDLAVVTFMGGLPAGYEPAKFLSKASALSVLQNGAVMKLAGYGITAPPPPPAPAGAPAPTPPPAGTPVVDDGSGTLRSVSTQFYEFAPLQIDMYLVGAAGHDICEGDSGGPAMINVGGEMFVVGVLSRGDCSQVAIYTFVNQDTISGL